MRDLINIFENIKQSINRTMLHVTPTGNVGRIMKQGLLPQIGERSGQIESFPAVFLFPDRVSAEDAVMGWLGQAISDASGEEYEEGEMADLALLEVTVPDNIVIKKTSGIDWECYVTQPISPEFLKVLSYRL